MTIALFPCKINPPHIGHIITLLQLMKDYDHIIIDILDCDILIPAEQAISILRKVLDFFPGKFSYIVHKQSYGTATDFQHLPDFDEVVSGNESICDNMKKNHFQVRFIPRTEGYRGEYIREAFLKAKKESRHVEI